MQIFNKIFERSLLLRLGVAMATITLLGVIGMASSIIIAGITQGNAETINIAGSLRMQSFRITSLLLLAQKNPTPESWRDAEKAIDAFEHTLLNPSLQSIDMATPETGLRSANSYSAIPLDWQRNIKPRLIALIPQNKRLEQAAFKSFDTALLIDIDGFVSHINDLVKHITQQTENRITLLGTILGISLFLTLIVVFVTMYIMYTDVFTPLRDLLFCTERAGKGDLSIRSQHTGEDELGRLGEAFNAMAEDLSKLYQNLEIRVQEKTVDLERSNRSLELLYHSITKLYDAPIASDTYLTLLTDIEHVLDIGHGVTCLLVNEHGSILASTLSTKEGDINICALSDCATCLSGESIHIYPLGQQQLLKIPLRDMEKHYGVMQLEVPLGKALEEWQTQLLEALSRHIGIAIGTAQRTEQNRRLSLLEERGVIARELHDSLAQSLSYMKIQVSRLQNNLIQHPEITGVNDILTELREGLNSAYRELRELLTTFRLKIEGDGLIPTLKKVTTEFAERGNLVIDFHTHLEGWHLSANEEIHIMQIVRESLSNIIHHANASHAWVALERDMDNMISVTIDDNGIGIFPKPQETHHYGMSIMQERARTLGGSLHVQPRAIGGTRILLRFRSGLHHNPIAAAQVQLT